MNKCHSKGRMVCVDCGKEQPIVSSGPCECGSRKVIFRVDEVGTECPENCSLRGKCMFTKEE